MYLGRREGGGLEEGIGSDECWIEVDEKDDVSGCLDSPTLEE